MKNKELRKLIFSKHNLPLLLAFIAISFFILGLLALNSYTSYKKEIERAQVDNNVLSIALEQYVETQFKTADLALSEMITLLPFIQNFDSAKKSQQFDEILSHYPGLETLGISDAAGKIVANSGWSDEMDKNLFVTDRQYFIAHKNNPGMDLVISDPIISRVTGNQIVIFCRKLPAPDGKFRGIILASINLEKFIQSFYEMGIASPNMSIGLLNEKRILLARYPFNPEQVGKYVPINPQMARLLAQGRREGTYEGFSTLDGVKRVFSYHSLKNYPLTVIVGKSKADILVSWRNFSITSALIGIFFNLFILFAISKYFINLFEYEKQKILLFNSAKMTSLGIMASGIAHKINNPLAIISGKSSQLLRLAGEENMSPEEVKRYAKKINETSFRIAKIVEKLKLISQSTNHEVEKTVRVSSLIENAAGLLSQKMQVNKIIFSSVVHDDVLLNVRESQIVQVLLNLIDDAFNAVKDQEKKWIQVKAMKMGAKILQISVSDSGERVSDKFTNEAMTPFLSAKALSHDSGLSLRISKSVVEDHHGRLFLDPNSANTRFVIELPIY